MQLREMRVFEREICYSEAVIMTIFMHTQASVEQLILKPTARAEEHFHVLAPYLSSSGRLLRALACVFGEGYTIPR